MIRSTTATTNETTPSMSNINNNTNTNTNNLTGNPLKDDPELRRLLSVLDNIDSKKSFRRWRKTFLDHLETYVDEEHSVPAEARYQIFTDSMGQMSLRVKKLYGHLEAGHLTQDRTTVRARKCLSDLQQGLEQVNNHLFGMLPKTAEQEKTLGYSKFHLGAVLVRDGFVEYDRLVICDEILQHMRGNGLSLVADRQILDNMDHYHNRLGMFCDVMADLGLYKVMLKCRELLQQEAEEEDDDDDDDEKEQQDEEQDTEEAKAPDVDKVETPPQEIQAPPSPTPSPPPSPPPLAQDIPKKETPPEAPVSPPRSTRKTPKAKGKFEVQIQGQTAVSTSPTDDNDHNNEAKQNQAKTETPTFSSFGHYYHGNSDWRIAATLKKERAMKQEGEKNKAKDKETKTTKSTTNMKTAASVKVQQSVDTNKGMSEKQVQPSNETAPPMQNVMSNSLANQDVADLGMESVHASMVPTYKVSASDSDDDDSDTDSDAESVDLTVVSGASKEWGPVLGPRGPNGRPNLYRTLSGIRDELGPKPTGSLPKKRRGKKPGYLPNTSTAASATSITQAATVPDEQAKGVSHPDKAYHPASHATSSAKMTKAKKAADAMAGGHSKGGKRADEAAVGFVADATPVTPATTPPKSTKMSPKTTKTKKAAAALASGHPKGEMQADEAAVSQSAEAISAPPATSSPKSAKKNARHKATKEEARSSSTDLAAKSHPKATSSPGSDSADARETAKSSGDPSTDPMPYEESEAFGYSVSMSENGLVAAGSPRHGRGGKGRVRVFYWDDDEDAWVLLGQEIFGKSAGDAFGASVSLSPNGKTLAVGSPQVDFSDNQPGYVRVYEYIEEDNYWSPMGSPILGLEKGDAFGWSVSLGGNGTQLVVGGPQSRRHAGVVRMFHWDESTWKSRGGVLRGDSVLGSSVAIAPNGKLSVAGCHNPGSNNFTTISP